VHVPLERVLVRVALHPVLKLACPLHHDALGEEVVDCSVEEAGDVASPFRPGFTSGLEVEKDGLA